jgi:hypothetical protein
MNPTVPFPPPPWRQYLDTLPEAEAPATLWPRLAAAQRQAQRRRRRPLWFGAAAAVLALALIAPRLLPTPATPAAPAAAGPSLALSPAADPGLRRLDDQIAQAYARGAGEDEVAVLWQARERVLASLEGPAPVVLARL